MDERLSKEDLFQERRTNCLRGYSGYEQIAGRVFRRFKSENYYGQYLAFRICAGAAVTFRYLTWEANLPFSHELLEVDSRSWNPRTIGAFRDLLNDETLLAWLAEKEMHDDAG